jgi:4'-phosphopantetheinyl transferase
MSSAADDAPPPIDLWVVSPESLDEASLAEGHRLMTAEERTRQRAFVFEKNRLEYLATRGLVRTVLSRYRDVARDAWAFRRNEYGRPELEPPCGLRFNLTNHPQLVACAVRHGELEVGCDVEPLSRGDQVLGIADTVFSDRELAELRALPVSAQADRAIALWTLKEAYIKARSMGMSLPLKEFAFAFSGASGAPGAPSSNPQISFTAEIDDAPARWAFAMIDLDGYRLSVAVESPQPEQRVCVWRLSGFADSAVVTWVTDVTLGAAG